MKDVFHVVPQSYDDEGFPVWQTPLTPTRNTKRAMVLGPPDHVIPVIFVPGIMGSNLKIARANPAIDKRIEDIAWRPDFAGAANALQSAATRQQLLNPRNTLVDTRVTVNGKCSISPPSGMSLKCAEFRGWGSIYWQSYGDVLMHLENVLNLPCFYEPELDRVVINAQLLSLIESGIAAPGQGQLKLQRSDLERMSEYWFPVHAFGYNWLQSNEIAGILLAKEIKRIIEFYQRKLKYTGACQTVILITHSMGGLVARAAVHPMIGNVEANVLGVLHGVMPAIGAAAAYKRMRTGFEHGEIDWFSLGSVKAELGGQAVAGRNGRDVTAVLGHSPGGLQLLPNKAYQPEGWLKMTGVESQPYVVAMNRDPYATIYREQNKWWKLIVPWWLDPANIFASDPNKSAWDSYDRALTQAEHFHDKLGHHYHPNTYCFYGADAVQHPSYGAVTWTKAGYLSQGGYSPGRNPTTNAEIMKNGVAYSEDATGIATAKLNYVTLAFEMTKGRDPGDGTVPSVSGAAPQQYSPGRIRTQLAVTGIDHQGAYRTTNQTVMNFMAYSVCKIAEAAT